MPLEVILDYSESKLPSGAVWITHPPQAPTMFVLDPCKECDHRVIFCLSGDAKTFYPNNSSCGLTFDIETIFPPAADQKSSKAHIVLPFQPDETSKKITSEQAKEMQAKSVEARKRNKLTRYDVRSP